MDNTEETNEVTTQLNADKAENIGEDYDVIEIKKVIELSDGHDVFRQDSDETQHNQDSEMDAIVQHERLDTTMLKYKANIANQRHRKPPTRGTALNRLTMQPAAFEFFDLEEFLDDNFEKSRKEILQNTEVCQMREKRGFDLDTSRRNRYSLPPVQPRAFGLTNNHLMQSKQRLALRSKIERDDESILRKKRPDQDEPVQDRTIMPVLRNVTNQDSSGTSEMRSSAPEYLLRSQRVRESWVEQNGSRIEKLLTENRHSDGLVNKRHSIAVSNLAAKFGETGKSPKPKLLPKPRSPQKIESPLVQNENGLKPIIPAVPKYKLDESSEKPKDKYTFKVETSPRKAFVPKEISIEETKEEKEAVSEPIKENDDAPKQVIKQTTPTKPSLSLQKPAVLPVKPANLSPLKKSFPVSKDFPSPTLEEKEKVAEEKCSPEKKAIPQEETKQNEVSKQIKPRPPIASKPKSLHRVRSDTEISRVQIRTKYNNNSADSRTNSVEEDNKRKTTVITLNNNKYDKSLKDANTENQNGDEKNIDTSDESNRKTSSSPQQKNCNRPTTPKNGTTTTDRSPIIKEKPIFAFLKAKEASNQQSFYKGSDLNRTFISSGSGTSGNAYLNTKDSIQEFGNSKPMIAQPKIITY